MADEPAPQAPPDVSSELPSDRCPNCGGPLKSFWDQPEALCPKCRIFVEILRAGGMRGSPSEPVAESLHHRLGLAKYHLMSEELDEEELEDEPQKVELEAGPPARYPPAPPAESLPPEPAAVEASGATAIPVDDRQSTEREEEPPEPPALESDASIPTEDDETPPEPLPQPEITVEDIPPPPEAEAAPEVEVYGEQGSQLVIEEPVERVSRYREVPPVPMARTESVQAAARVSSTRPPRPRRSHRVIFYAGGVNVAFGGAVLVFGSFLHDFFRVPFIGESYDVFGPLNLFAAQLGALFVVLGVVAMMAAARRGRRPTRQTAGG